MNCQIPRELQKEDDVMRANAILSLSGLVLALSMPTWAQVQTLPTQTVTINGTVETIDHAKRAVNIKTSDGKFETIDVPPSATRFNELKGTRCR